MNSTRRSILALPALAAGLVSCGKSGKRIIAVIPKGRSHLFWQSVHAGAVAAARETGVEIAWNGPSTETDFNGQIQIVESMINRRVDAIALAPIDKKVMVGVVERAAKEKIPVIIFDSPVDTDKFVSQVATDNYAAGKMAAERLGSILNGKGRIIIVACQVGAASTMAREQGFEDKIKESFPDIKILDKRYGMSEVATSRTVAENMLTAFPDVDGVFASNETSSMGAALALKARKSKAKMVGFDFGPTLEEDMKLGVVDSLVVQNPFKMGYESVKSAVAALDGKPVEKIDNLAPKLVSMANLNEPEVQAQVHPDLKKYLD
jgi:ribose transport system substrate-binding protein